MLQKLVKYKQHVIDYGLIVSFLIYSIFFSSIDLVLLLVFGLNLYSTRSSIKFLHRKINSMKREKENQRSKSQIFAHYGQEEDCTGIYRPI